MTSLPSINCRNCLAAQGSQGLQGVGLQSKNLADRLLGPPSKRTRSTMKQTATPMSQPLSQNNPGAIVGWPDRQHLEPSYLYKHPTQARYTDQKPQKQEKNVLDTVTELNHPFINPLSSLCQGFEFWNYKKTLVQKLAKAKTASHAINAVYNHDFDITQIDGWRTCAVNKIDERRALIHHHLQYHTHFAPMIIEKWALSLFMKAGLQPATTSAAACTDIEYACCQICNYPGGFEPIKSLPLYLDVYICDVCQ
eukprot:566064-Pelagomonas_calceolata.AAC.2